MAYSQIIFEKIDRVAKITLNRPKVKNALSPELMSEMGDAIGEVSRNSLIKALIITGVGDTFKASV